jgi:hypothetical protein
MIREKKVVKPAKWQCQMAMPSDLIANHLAIKVPSDFGTV